MGGSPRFSKFVKLRGSRDFKLAPFCREPTTWRVCCARVSMGCLRWGVTTCVISEPPKFFEFFRFFSKINSAFEKLVLNYLQLRFEASLAWFLRHLEPKFRKYDFCTILEIFNFKWGHQINENPNEIFFRAQNHCFQSFLVCFRHFQMIRKHFFFVLKR